MRTQYLTREQRTQYVTSVTRGHEAWQRTLRTS